MLYLCKIWSYVCTSIDQKYCNSKSDVRLHFKWGSLLYPTLLLYFTALISFILQPSHLLHSLILIIPSHLFLFIPILLNLSTPSPLLCFSVSLISNIRQERENFHNIFPDVLWFIEVNLYTASDPNIPIHYSRKHLELTMACISYFLGRHSLIVSMFTGEH